MDRAEPERDRRNSYTAPLATGSKPSPSAGSERYTANNSVTTRMPLIIDRRSAAGSILARASTANTLGPLNFKAPPPPAARGRRKGCANGGDCCACASLSEPPRGGLRHHQRARTIRRNPDAVARPGPAVRSTVDR